MLTRSANASPIIHGFHYAPSHPSPGHSSPRNSAVAAPTAAAASAARRPSSSSSPLVNGASASLLSNAASSNTSLSDRASTSAPSSPALSHAPSFAFSHPPTPLAAPLARPHHQAPPLSRSPPRYVAVDAATQYSPMEPFDYNTTHRHQQPPSSVLHSSTTAAAAAAAAAAPPPPPLSSHALDPSSSSSQPPSKQSTPREIPRIPGPVPMEPGIEQGVDHAAASAAAVTNGARHTNNGRPAPGAPATAQPVTASTTVPAPVSGPASATSSTSASIPPSLSSDHTAAASSVADPPSASSSAPSQQPYTTSPQKRRSSPAPPTRTGRLPSPSVADSPPTAAKRARPEAAPVKMLPEQYDQCPVEDMVVLIANMLGELIETNDALALKSGHLTRFHSRTPPGISVLDYLHRLAKHATLIPPLLLSMVYYIDRLCAMYPDFTINTLTVHRFLITAATVAAKGLSDSFWNNSTYARVGGVRVAELKMLELEFLYRLEWKIVPNPEVLAAYYRPLVERCPGYALPSDHTPSRHEHEMIDDDNAAADDENGNGNDDPATGSAAPHLTGHNRQSSTTLIGEDLVVSGLTRQTSR
ncbi:cyclin-dependent protein kinase regulator pho80 [Sporothrix brasiliensis 5110]|uniref:Cyclin-dependent protein kinase regulator pho80 n=1 Tax=Sporothrix brasiliensis 5110 TaxID=1398154 RepID=A0A0C2FKI1_9PEZI|nr:cyclin-dependent protein kinase regulator pho80 [Sporothrix brasiliensis 5110]KIH91583.1 cyclin-dependent protein kinase regulator pho80 [Sporothrix brasiliensis 5110]